MWKSASNLLLALAVGLSCGCAVFSKNLLADEAARRPYQLQIGDEIELSLAGNAESAVKTEIREDGSLLYPASGFIPAAGLSLRELEELISNQLQTQRTEGFTVPEIAVSSLEVLSPSQAAQQVYLLQPGDQLDVTVWDHAEISQKIQIRDDGLFQYPLIGEVKAAGRSLPKVEREIRDRLDQDYIVTPQVTVRMIGAQFSVLGQKGDSGSFPLEGAMDLLTAISKAGDISTLRAGRVEIIRRQGGRQVTIRTDVDRVLSGKEVNIPVFPRDTLYIKLPNVLDTGYQISAKVLNAKFTILGEVTNPGAYLIEGAVDVLAAVSMAGGITKFGSSRVEIIRNAGQEKVVIPTNVDRILSGREPNLSIHPRDTLYVKRRLF